MQQTITWAKFMAPYDLTRPHLVNGLMPDKIKGVGVDALFLRQFRLLGSSDCLLHMDIPTYEQNLFYLIWNHYI